MALSFHIKNTRNACTLTDTETGAKLELKPATDVNVIIETGKAGTSYTAFLIFGDTVYCNKEHRNTAGVLVENQTAPDESQQIKKLLKKQKR